MVIEKNTLHNGTFNQKLLCTGVYITFESNVALSWIAILYQMLIIAITNLL